MYGILNGVMVMRVVLPNNIHAEFERERYSLRVSVSITITYTPGVCEGTVSGAYARLFIAVDVCRCTYSGKTLNPKP